MSERKPIGKKLRFEVFKRDSFKCQYCGQEAPKVVLNCDHIHPVAEGGDNDISNLITACWDCNSGKGARMLKDDTVVKKQKQQLNELNERRIQLEMVSEWRTGLKEIESQTVSIIEDYWIEQVGKPFTKKGKRQILKWIDKYTLDEIFDAMDKSIRQYLIDDGEGGYTSESKEKTFNYVSRIASVCKRSQATPYLQDLYYIKGILVNRGLNINEGHLLSLLRRACEGSDDPEELVNYMKQYACEVSSWSKYRSVLERFLVFLEERNGSN